MHCIDEMGDERSERMGRRSPMQDYRDNWKNYDDDDDDRYDERRGGRRSGGYRY